MTPLEAKAEALAEWTPLLLEAGATDVECAHQVGGVLARCVVDGLGRMVVGRDPGEALALLLEVVER